MEISELSGKHNIPINNIIDFFNSCNQNVLIGIPITEDQHHLFENNIAGIKANLQIEKFRAMPPNYFEEKLLRELNEPNEFPILDMLVPDLKAPKVATRIDLDSINSYVRQNKMSIGKKNIEQIEKQPSENNSPATKILETNIYSKNSNVNKSLIDLYNSYSGWLQYFKIRKSDFSFKEGCMQPYIASTFEKQIEVATSKTEIDNIIDKFVVFERDIFLKLRMCDKHSVLESDSLVSGNLEIRVTDIEGKVIHGVISIYTYVVISDEWVMANHLIEKAKGTGEELYPPVRQRKVRYVNAPDIVHNHNVRFWSCSICDGDSETGCMYFDPTECPRH